MLFYKLLLFFTSILLATGCGGTHNHSAGKESSNTAGALAETGSVAGTLTVNGGVQKLNQVYARRIHPLDREVLGILLTNKPLPTNETAGLFENFSPLKREQDFLTDKSINGVFLQASKESYKGNIFYNPYFLIAGRLYHIPYREAFQDFRVKQSRISGAARFNRESDGTFSTDDGRRYQCGYEVSFEANLQGERNCKEADGLPPAASPPILSNQGTVAGTLTIMGDSIDLNHAYAQRRRLFFDEPDEQILLLMTDRAVSATELSELFDEDIKKPVEGIKAIALIFHSCDPARSQVVLYHEKIKFGSLGIGRPRDDLTITKEKIVASSDGQRARGDGEDWAFSVKIEALFSK